jgi:membrane fusion protein (multidrug efflux system)
MSLSRNSNHPLRRHGLWIAMALALGLSACGGGGPATDANAQGNGEATEEEAPAEEEQASQAVPVEVVAASRQRISASYTGTASLEAPRDAQVVAKTSGVIVQILAEEGQRVQAGQALARLDGDRARLEVQRAQATVRRLENNYRRSQELMQRRLVSAEANDQIRFELESARASLNLAQLELSYTTITAPISGVVAQRMGKPGNLVALNAPVFRIVDTSRLEAVLNVPERELGKLRAGMPVRMAVDALAGQAFEGTIDRLSPVVDAGSGTFRVVCAFDGGETLSPGMFGRISIIYDQRDGVLTVPRTALLEGDGETAVYVVREDKAVRVPVGLGYVNGEYAEIRSGINEGDRVITAGKVAVRDGTLVEIIQPHGETAATEEAAPAAPAAAEAEAEAEAETQDAN